MKITQTAFYLLGVNIHNSRSEIRALSETASFIKDEEACRNAERNLLQPNKRVEQEIAWLPGTPPDVATELVKKALTGYFTRRYKESQSEFVIPPLAASNLLCESIPNMLCVQAGLIDAAQIKGIVRTAAEIDEEIDTADVLSLINEDRRISSFGEVTVLSLLDENIENQRKELRTTISNVLQNLDSDTETTVLAELVDEITEKGTKQNLSLLDEVIAEYEMRKQDIHQQLEKRIKFEVAAIRNELSKNDGRDDSVINDSLEGIKQSLNLWQKSIHPILVSYKSKGIAHKTAESIIADIRSLCIYAYEDCDVPDVFKALGESLAFAVDTVPKFSDLVKSDLEYLRHHFSAIQQVKKVKELCQRFEKVPDSCNEIKRKFRELQNILQSEFSTETIESAAGDWICLLYIKYGAALANHHNDVKGAAKIFKEANSIAKSDRIAELLNQNKRTIKANVQYLEKRKVDEPERLKKYQLELEPVKRANRWRLMLAGIIITILIVGVAKAVLYVNSPQYTWEYLSPRSLQEQISYLRTHPKSEIKSQLSQLIVSRINSLDDTKQIEQYLGEDMFDTEAVYEAITEAPSHNTLSLFQQMCPRATDTQKAKIGELHRELEKQEWGHMRTPLNIIKVRRHTNRFKGVVDKREIQQRVVDSLIESTDPNRIASFLKFIDDSVLQSKLEKHRKKLLTSFEYAKKLDTIEAYQQFIEASDNPEEKEQARKRIIDLEVANIARGKHSDLSAQHNNPYRYSSSGYADISIKNSTDYPITVMYSGRDSQKLIIPAGHTQSIHIQAGNYSIAVTTEQPNVIPFYGNETIASGGFEITYYIRSNKDYLPSRSPYGYNW